MNNEFSPGPYTSVKGYGVKPDVELPRVISDKITALYNWTGTQPKLLLLGYGTYLTLCVTTRHIREMGLITAPTPVPRLTVFRDIPIVIDPTIEFRIEVLQYNDPWDDASRAAQYRLERLEG